MTEGDSSDKLTAMKQNLHQQAAEKMRAKILKEARTLFLTKGFSGTSIGALAKQADINQSLIYHYFKNKEELWRNVKADTLATSLKQEELEVPKIDSLDELLEHLVKNRFQLYADNPDLVRLLLWQALEEDAPLSGTSEAWLEKWLQNIKRLQSQKKIVKDYTPQEVMLMLNGIVWAPFITAQTPELTHDGKIFCQKALASMKRLLAVSPD